MSTLTQEGYDLAIGLDLDALQALLIPAVSDFPLEKTLGVTVVSGASVRYRVDTPTIDAASGQPGQLLLRCGLDFTFTLAAQKREFTDGEIVLAASPAGPSGRVAVLDVTDVRKQLSTAGTSTGNATVSDEDIRRILDAITTEAANAIDAVPLHRPIPNASTPGPGDVERIAARFASGTNDELHLLVRTFAEHAQSAGTGAVDGFVDGSANAGLLLTQSWLLQVLILPALNEAFPNAFEFSSNPPRITTRPEARPLATRGNAKMKDLAVKIEGDRIEFSGHVSDSGRGWSADGTFEFALLIDVGSDNVLSFASTEIVVLVDVSLAWWRVLLAILGAIVGGIIGFIVGGPGLSATIIAIAIGAIVGAFLGIAVSEVIEEVLIHLATGAVLGVVDTATAPFRLEGLLRLSLPVSVEGITLGDVDLERELVMTGRIRRRATMPVFAEGTATLASGQTLDLDGGRLDPGGLPDVAVALGPFGPQLIAQNGTRFARLSGRFEAITLDDLATRAYTLQSVVLPPAFPFPNQSATVGVRTSEGLFGKLRVRRKDGRLEVRHVTYAVAAPRHMTIEGEAVVVSETTGVGPRGGGRFGGMGFSTLIGYEGWYFAEHFNLRGRRTYTWSFDGKELREGQETDIESGAVATAYPDGQVVIRTKPGQSLDGRLRVSVIGSGGVGATAQRYIALRGSRRGGPVHEGVLEVDTTPPKPRRPRVLDSEKLAELLATITPPEEDTRVQLVGALRRGGHTL